MRSGFDAEFGQRVRAMPGGHVQGQVALRIGARSFGMIPLILEHRRG